MYAASIDTIAVYNGYGQVDERPTGIPEDWVLREDRGSTVYSTYEEAVAETDAMESRYMERGGYTHGWSIPENEDGTYGPVAVSYWGPPDPAVGGPDQSDLAVAAGLGSSVLCGVTVLALILV